jgi:hypothetical protein
MSMNQRERDALDRHITGNYGEDQLREQPGMCIWEDCGNDAIYCEGHAREYMQPDLDELRRILADAESLRPKLLRDFGYVPEYVLEFCNVARAAIARKH